MHPWMKTGALTLLLAATGCQNDERLAQMATQAVATQHEQNRLMHQSNQKLIETTTEVTQQGRILAEAAERLVEQDAEARKELILAHREMRGELQAERAGIDEAQAGLDAERREIAAQRQRDPIVAEAIQTVGLWLAALLPVCLAGYVLYSANRSTADQAAVNELLVLDLTSDRPRLSSRESPLSIDRPDRPALPKAVSGPPPF